MIRFTLLAALAAPLTAQGETVPFARADALVNLQVDGPIAWQRAFADTNLAALLSDSRVRALLGPLQALARIGARSAGAEVGADAGELYEALLDYRGRVTLSADFKGDLMRGTSTPAPVFVVVLSPDDEVDFADIVELLEEAAASMETDTLEAFGQTLRTVQGSGMVPAVIDGHLVMFGGSRVEEAIEHFGAARQGGVLGLARGDAPFWLRLDLRRLARLAFAPDVGTDVEPDEELLEAITDAFGMNSLGPLDVRLRPDGERAVFEVQARDAAAATGYLGLWLADAPARGPLPPVVLPDADIWGVQPVRPARVVALLQRVSAALPGANSPWDDAASGFAELTGLDLEKDLIAHLGKRLVVALDAASYVGAATGETADGLCLAMEIEHAGALRATVDAVLERFDLRAERTTHAGVAVLDVPRLDAAIGEPAAAMCLAIADEWAVFGAGESGVAMARRVLTAIADGTAPALPDPRRRSRGPWDAMARAQRDPRRPARARDPRRGPSARRAAEPGHSDRRARHRAARRS